MASSMRIKTSLRDGLTTVRAIIRHPMHTGYEFDKETGKLIPAHYIDNVTVHHGEKLILHCEWGRAISANPYLSFSFTGARAGDKLRIYWTDNLGGSDSVEMVIQ
jgi:sulfur-oxidizing protein SoxZ